MQSALVQQRIATAVLAKTHEIANDQAEAAIGLLTAASETADQSDESHDHHVDVTA